MLRDDLDGEEPDALRVFDDGSLAVTTHEALHLYPMDGMHTVGGPRGPRHGWHRRCVDRRPLGEHLGLRFAAGHHFDERCLPPRVRCDRSLRRFPRHGGLRLAARARAGRRRLRDRSRRDASSLRRQRRERGRAVRGRRDVLSSRGREPPGPHVLVGRGRTRRNAGRLAPSLAWLPTADARNRGPCMRLVLAAASAIGTVQVGWALASLLS